MRKSRFLKLLHQEAGAESKKLIIACCGAGIAQGIAIFSILTGLEQLADQGVEFQVLLLFFVSIITFYLLFRHLSEKSALFALQAVMKKRTLLASKLRAVPMQYFMQLKRERIQSILLNNQDLVVEAARMFTASVTNSIMMIVALMRMFSISIAGACMVIGLMVSGLYIFIQIIKGVNTLKASAFTAELHFSKDLESVQKGFQHLKIHLLKTVDLFKKSLYPHLQSSMNARQLTEKKHARGISFFAVFNLIILGAMLFVLPSVLSLPTEDTTSLIVLVVFCVTPLMSLVSFVPMLGKVEMDLHELHTLEQELELAMEKCEQRHVENGWIDNDLEPLHFESLNLVNVRFAHKNSDDTDSYSIFIPSFTLKRGEIVFICGGNGAGKTTFMRLLSGLYMPQEGSFTINSKPLAELGIEKWRNLFSIVPADFHLFNQTFGIRQSPKHMNETLAMMQLENKVQILENGTFSTQNLSTGQRKRLALACALLEDRDILLFDEVSADFDPAFRRYFYEQMLHNIRADGKTILAISHDDRYFSQADRIIHMADGTFRSTESGKI